MGWFDRLPQHVKSAFLIGGAALSIGSEQLPIYLQTTALWAGLIFIAIGAVGTARYIKKEGFFRSPWGLQRPSWRISLLELLSEAATKGWVFNRDTLQEFALALRQAASNGIVVIWGIPKNGRDPVSAPSLYVYEKIAASYFKEHWIEAHQGWMHKDNRYVNTALPSGRNAPNLYSDLHVEKETARAWLGNITK